MAIVVALRKKHEGLTTRVARVILVVSAGNNHLNPEEGVSKMNQIPWGVSVWFGARCEATVIENFATEAEAVAFANQYTMELYPECTVRVFAPVVA